MRNTYLNGSLHNFGLFLGSATLNAFPQTFVPSELAWDVLAEVDVELDAHLCRYTSVGATNWGGRTPGSQDSRRPRHPGHQRPDDGGRKMLQNCSKLPLIAATTDHAQQKLCVPVSVATEKSAGLRR